jgi:endonuclease III
MPPRPTRLARTLGTLERLYGKQKPPPARGALELVLWENVAYLVSDEQREKAFAALKKHVGTKASKILAAPYETLLGIASTGGMHPERRVEKWIAIAETVVRDHDGNLGGVLELPLAAALRALQVFPGIGRPGAEKILLFSGAHALPALESNALRALVRLGFAAEEKSYDKTYRAVQTAIASELPATVPAWTRAHLLLRRHGQELCKNSAPLCDECPLADGCAYYARKA